MDCGQIFTNKNVATYMASLFCLRENALLLDPCFGEGVFLGALLEQGYNNIVGYEIDPLLFKKTKTIYPVLDLFNRDFLKVDNKIKYDGIIMNPPYIRQEKIDELKPLGITKSKLRKNEIFCSLPSTANLYMYFIFKAIELLKNDGQLVVIFPGSWIQARSGHKFKEALYSKCTLLKQVFLSGEVFDTEALVDVVILKLQKGNIDAIPCVENIEFNNGALCKYKDCVTTDSIDFDIGFNQIGSVKRGLTTGCNEMYINPPFIDEKSYQSLVPIISSPKSIIGFDTSSAKTDKLFFPKREIAYSEEIIAYINQWKRKISKDKAPKTLFEKIKKDELWYHIKTVKSTGILFSYIVRNDMKFIFNNAAYLARDNFYVIESKIDPLITFAFLNNYYTFFQLEKLGKKYGAGLLKVQKYDIEELTFPDIASFADDDKNQLRDLALELLETNNREIIANITKIVAKKSSIKYDEIYSQYQKIKRLRLEG